MHISVVKSCLCMWHYICVDCIAVTGAFRFKNTHGCTVRPFKAFVVVILKKQESLKWTLRVAWSRGREARAGVIWSCYLFPGRRRHNLCFETAAGGKVKIDQHQNTGNYSNPDHQQQTCESLSPIGSEAAGSLIPPKRHLMRTTQSMFPMRSFIQLEIKSRYYLILKTFSSFFCWESTNLRSEALITCTVQSANGRLLYTLVLMTIKEAFLKVLISSMKWWHISVVFSLVRLLVLLPTWGDSHVWLQEGRKKP